MVPATIYHIGEITFETGTRKKYRRNSNRQFRNVDVYRATITIGKKLGAEKVHHISDWMPGKPFDVNDKNPKEPPIFRTLTDGDFLRYIANQYSLNTQIPGKVAAKSKEWQIAKGYLPCNYYTTFPDFQLAFVNCVTETITTMLKDGNAHTEVYDAPKFKLTTYSKFHGDVPKS